MRRKTRVQSCPEKKSKRVRKYSLYANSRTLSAEKPGLLHENFIDNIKLFLREIQVVQSFHILVDLF